MYNNKTFNLPFTLFTPHLTVLVPLLCIFSFPSTPSSHRAAFNFLHNSRVRHPPPPPPLHHLLVFSPLSPGRCRCRVLPSICVSPLALALVLAQIHRAPSAPARPPSRACPSTCPCRSAPNRPASPCRPSKTGERCSSVTLREPLRASHQGLCCWVVKLQQQQQQVASFVSAGHNFPFHCRPTSAF